MASKRKIQVFWEIHPRALYLIHEVPSNAEHGIKVELLAECTAPGRLTGHYRWAFGGGNVEMSRRLNTIMEVEEDFWLDINSKPDDINIRENNCTGPWEDLADWVAKDKIGVQKNNENARDELLGKKKKTKINYVLIQFSKKQTNHSFTKTFTISNKTT